VPENESCESSREPIGQGDIGRFAPGDPGAKRLVTDLLSICNHPGSGRRSTDQRFILCKCMKLFYYIGLAVQVAQLAKHHC